MNSRISVDDLNDEQLERLAAMLAIRSRVRSLRTNRESMAAKMQRELAGIDCEIATATDRLNKLREGAELTAAEKARAALAPGGAS